MSVIPTAGGIKVTKINQVFPGSRTAKHEIHVCRAVVPQGDSTQLLGPPHSCIEPHLALLDGSSTSRPCAPCMTMKPQVTSPGPALPCQHLWHCWKPGGQAGEASLLCWLPRQEFGGPITRFTAWASPVSPPQLSLEAADWTCWC